MLRKPCRLQTDGRTDGRTDRRTDGRTRWIQYTPPPTSLGGGIINTGPESIKPSSTFSEIKIDSWIHRCFISCNFDLWKEQFFSFKWLLYAVTCHCLSGLNLFGLPASPSAILGQQPNRFLRPRSMVAGPAHHTSPIMTSSNGNIFHVTGSLCR